MNNYWMLFVLLQIVGLRCAEEAIETPQIEVLIEGVVETNDHFIGEIATDKNSMAYLDQHYGKDSVARAHAVIFNTFINPKAHIVSLTALISHYKLDISGLNYTSLSLLHYACWRQSTDFLQYLLDNHADPEVRDEWIYKGIKYGGTVLHWACRKKNVAALKLLLGRETINKELTDSRGATPLHWACKSGHLAILMALVQAGANLQAKDEDGNTPLHYAYMYYINMTVSYLKRIGADTQAKNNAGLTPKEVRRKGGCTIL